MRRQDPGAPRRDVLEAARRRVETILHRARRVPAPLPVGAVLDLPRETDAAARDAVTTVLHEALLRAVGQSWQRGWQPADLDRAVRREHKDPVVLALAEGVRAELATYARSTVDPRWWRQVSELPEDRAPGRDRAPGPGASDPVRDWQQACRAVLEAALFVERLPALALLGAVPGQRQHVDVERGAGASPVDDKLLTKVRRLLAQAEGTPYEAEAETFTAAAQSLMARYRIDRALLESAEPAASRRPDAVRLSVDRPYEAPKMQLLHQVCLANRCTAVWSQGAGFATVVGFESDRRAVELLYTSLLLQATTAMRREGEAEGEAARSRGFRSSFLLGFATRIGQRLRDTSQAAEAEAETRLGNAPAGAGAEAVAGHAARRDALAVVLTRRDDEVRSRTRELFPRVQTGRARQVSDYAGFLQGRAAADRADLGTGGRLTGRAS